MTLSIIILNYDTSDLLRDCLDSIAKYPPDCDYEIIVINNGSKRDRAADLVGLHPFAQVYDLPVNCGFGVANNLGMELARGEYFLLLNSDTYFVDESLQTSLEFAQEHPEIDIFTCPTLRPDGSVEPGRYPLPQSPAWGVFHGVVQVNPIVRRLFPTLWQQWAPRESEDCWLAGCFLFLRRGVFEKTGGFDPDFFLYFEELEWFAHRIYLEGFRSGVCQGAKLFHIGSGAQVESTNDQFTLSCYLYSYKLGPRAFAACCAARMANILVELACLPLAPGKLKSRFSAQTRSLRCLWHALIEIPRYPPTFGARPAPLLSPENSRLFSWSELSRRSLKRTRS